MDERLVQAFVIGTLFPNEKVMPVSDGIQRLYRASLILLPFPRRRLRPRQLQRLFHRRRWHR